MKKSIETKWTKMLSVRLDKNLYSLLEKELELQRKLKGWRLRDYTMTDMVSEMLENELSTRQGFRDMTDNEK